MASRPTTPPQNIDLRSMTQATSQPNPTAQSATAQSAKPQPASQTAALLALLKVEADARDAASSRDLVLIMANETRKLTRARQIFVMMPGHSGALEVRGVTSLPAVDRSAPLIIFIEQLVATAAKAGKLSALHILEMPERGADSSADTYPFRALVWLPLQHGSGAARGGMLLAREDVWAEQDLIVAQRLSGTYAHALRSLEGPPRNYTRHLKKFSVLHAAAAGVLLAALIWIEVPLSALAPVEIIARDPFVVAAPIEGVIEHVAVEPNQQVKKGDLLVKLADTTLKNRFEVALREAQVAEARLKQSNQVAFTDPRGMHEIGIARAELALKLAEREFASDLLAKTQIRAERDGIAMYSDKRDLIGRPVAVGERMLEVADASMLEARIDLPVSDAIALTAGAHVKLFLDSDPLRPWSASVRRADYKAKIGENDIVSFRVISDLKAESGRALPRLGVRGTAQVSGNKVPLALYLFRRPVTALRQWLGR